MLWGVEANVTERFAAAGVAEGNIAFDRCTYRFESSGSPTELVDVFRDYYGPTMNAFEAATAAGRADDLYAELSALFEAQNTGVGATSIPATYLRVTVTV